MLKNTYDSGELLSSADAPYKRYIYASEMRAFSHKKQPTHPSHKRSTHNCGLYVLVYTGTQSSHEFPKKWY